MQLFEKQTMQLLVDRQATFRDRMVLRGMVRAAVDICYMNSAAESHGEMVTEILRMIYEAVNMLKA